MYVPFRVLSRFVRYDIYCFPSTLFSFLFSWIHASHLFGGKTHARSLAEARWLAGWLLSLLPAIFSSPSRHFSTTSLHSPLHSFRYVLSVRKRHRHEIISREDRHAMTRTAFALGDICVGKRQPASALKLRHHYYYSYYLSPSSPSGWSLLVSYLSLSRG